VYVGLQEVYWREKGTPTRRLEPESDADADANAE